MCTGRSCSLLICGQDGRPQVCLGEGWELITRLAAHTAFLLYASGQSLWPARDASITPRLWIQHHDINYATSSSPFLLHHSCKAPQLHWCCSWSKEGFSPQLPHNTQTHAHINTHSLTIKSSHHRFFATPLCCDWTQSSCWNGAFFNNLCLLSWRAYFLFKCAVRKKVFSSTVILTISICLGLERYKKTMKWFL